MKAEAIDAVMRAMPASMLASLAGEAKMLDDSASVRRMLESDPRRAMAVAKELGIESEVAWLEWKSAFDYLFNESGSLSSTLFPCTERRRVAYSIERMMTKPQAAIRLFGDLRRWDGGFVEGADVIRATPGGEAEARLDGLGYKVRETSLAFVAVGDSHFYMEGRNENGDDWGIVGFNYSGHSSMASRLAWAVDGVDRRPRAVRMMDSILSGLGRIKRLA